MFGKSWSDDNKGSDIEEMKFQLVFFLTDCYHGASLLIDNFTTLFVLFSLCVKKC